MKLLIKVIGKKYYIVLSGNKRKSMSYYFTGFITEHLTFSRNRRKAFKYTSDPTNCVKYVKERHEKDNIPIRII